MSDEKLEKDITPILRKGFKIKEVNVSFSMTQNLGDYNSAKLQAGLVVTPPAGEDFTEAQLQDVFDQLWEYNFDQVRKQREAVLARNKGG